jgi:predicted O-methyltransferase YrrM
VRKSLEILERPVSDNAAYIESVLGAISETESGGLLSDRHEQGLDGISGSKTVGLLQRLVRGIAGDASSCYLEVGVFQGLTLISAALETPDVACFGIDNFATLDPDGTNLGIVRQRMATFGTQNAHLINQDFEVALEALDTHIGERKVGVYFVDGPHDYRSQLICLMLIKPFLHENAVIVIDDANYPDVRWSTRDFLLGHREFKLAFDAYSPAHPANMSEDEKPRYEAGWLNGVNVIVHDPADVLDAMLPPTNDHERTMYLNEWLAHRLRLGELAPQALILADAVCSGDAEAEAAARAALSSAYAPDAEMFAARFADRNMYSAGLTESRLNRKKG